MDKKQDLVNELKEDAKRAWSFIKQGAQKLGTYTLLTLSLASNSVPQEFESIKDDYKNYQQTQHKLDNKLSNQSSGNTANYTDFANVPTPFQITTPEKRAENIYQNITKDRIVAQELSLDELMSKAGITKEDIQSIFSKNQDRLKDLIPGKVGSALAKSADKVTGENKEGCLLGVQKIFGGAGIGNIICGSNPNWPQKIKGCSNNSACNAYIPLEKSGKFVNITLDNIAYNKSKISPESQELKAFCKTLPAGSIIITDNKMADEHMGRRYKELKQLYGTGGRLHGHIAIKDNHGLYKEEGVSIAPSFHNYGKTFKVSLSTDYQVPKDLALQLIAAKERRLENEKESNAKTTHQNPLNNMWKTDFSRT